MNIFMTNQFFGGVFVNTESVHENEQVFHFVPPGD